jgi:hypothetical protein
LKTAPELARGLQQAYFNNTERFQAISEGQEIEFRRGGYTWNLSYLQFEDEAGEGLSLARYGRHVPGDIEDIHIYIQVDGTGSARRVTEAGIKHTLAGSSSFEQSTEDTTQAVRAADKMLQAFRNAGLSSPKQRAAKQ